MTSLKFRALTHNDHKLFFEALCEYGKDFQNIQQYMTAKCGKNSNNSKSNSSDQSKLNNTINQHANSQHQTLNNNNANNHHNHHHHNHCNNINNNQTSIDLQEKRDQEKKEDDKKREQIRNLYNRLYSKLAQLVGKLDDRVEKVNQELYLLINYGEIWKKHGFKFNNKTKRLLEELVNQGYTTLRFKSKNVRLRTPPCKALKKINKIGIDEETNLVTSRELPKDVIVEFHPATNRDWLRVQSISQNPRVRARLSMQKRISNILEFLESKWYISPDKLSRTVDSCLKLPQNNQQTDDLHNLQHQQQNHQYFPNQNNVTTTNLTASNANSNNNNNVQVQPYQLCLSPLRLDELGKIRLKPSAQHELKEVNITRVVPDYHLDLSLNGYIKRLGLPEHKAEDHQQTGKNITRDHDDPLLNSCNSDHSLGATSNNSRLPMSLVTPDASVILERSSTTSDQPSTAQARKQLNFLQNLATSFIGCENSRTACDETTQEKLLPPVSTIGVESSRSAFPLSSRNVSFADESANDVIAPQSTDVIAALIDEDAAIDPPVINCSTPQHHPLILTQNSSLATAPNTSNDGQKEKSNHFGIPKNVTLGEWFTSAREEGGDDANDAFPVASESAFQMTSVDHQNNVNNNEFVSHENGQTLSPKEGGNELKKNGNNNNTKNSNEPYQQTNHVIEIRKIAEGWTSADQSSMTIGELYLAFKCPDKIILEYEFSNELGRQKIMNPGNNLIMSNNNESNQVNHNNNSDIVDPCQDKSLVFKLLTAASLSLAHMEKLKQEQQHKLHDMPGVKYIRRRKGQVATIKNQGLAQAMTPHEVQATNQMVDEMMKTLQPKRLSVNRRAR